MSKDNATINPASDGGTIEWTSSSPSVASLSGGQATGNAVGSTAISAKYVKGGSVKATSNIASLNVVQRSLSLSLNPTTVNINGTSQATASFTTTTASSSTVENVTSSSNCTLTAYAAATGSTLNPIVQINKSTGVITASSSGTCYIEASYTLNNKVYKSSRVQFTIMPGLNLQWTAQPAYVAQRGLLEAGDVTGSGTTVSYSVTSGSNKVRLVANGNNTYVELLSSGSYTIKATASNGQSGEYSGSVTAPVLTLSTNSLNANPDGTVAKTGTFGLDGSTLSVSYKSGDGTVTFGTSGNAIVTGNYLHTSLYNELLAPQYSSNNSIITASADGIYANDVYTPTTGTLATVTVAPKVSSTGVSSRAVTVKGVDPFYYWTGSLSNIVNDLPDEEDFGLVNAYHQFHNHPYTSHTASFERIMATVTRCGIAVLRNGNALPAGALNSCFTSSLVSNAWRTTYKLSDEALSEHIGGEIALRGYVRNYYSNNYVYSNGGHSFRLYVNGAVGAKMEGAGTSVVKISTAWAGAEGSYAFGQMAGLGQAKFVTTDYHNGQLFYSSVLTNTTVQNVVAAGAPLGVVVYELHREGGTLPAAQIKAAERPRFKFNSISTLGVFVDDVELEAFYYLAPPGTPTFDDNGKIHGYYKLYLLENLEIKAKGGWVD